MSTGAPQKAPASADRPADRAGAEAAGGRRAAGRASSARTPGPIERLHPAAEAVRAWFFSNSWTAAAAWCALVLVLVAVLVWFFVFSPFGAPAKPVYAEF